MKKLLTILMAVALMATVSSCKKDDPNDPNNPNAAPCVQNNTGTLKVDSYKDDPYYIYVNGAYKGTVGAYGVVSYTLSAGTYSTKYTQKSGYILYPTEYTSSVNITKCYETTVKIQ
jgi:hypothetical protein